jgi:hypothetical protein
MKEVLKKTNFMIMELYHIKMVIDMKETLIPDYIMVMENMKQFNKEFIKDNSEMVYTMGKGYLNGEMDTITKGNIGME